MLLNATLVFIVVMNRRAIAQEIVEHIALLVNLVVEHHHMLAIVHIKRIVEIFHCDKLLGRSPSLLICGLLLLLESVAGVFR